MCVYIYIERELFVFSLSLYDIYIYIYMYVCMYVRTYVHIYIYIYIYIHTYIGDAADGAA